MFSRLVFLIAVIENYQSAKVLIKEKNMIP